LQSALAELGGDVAPEVAILNLVCASSASGLPAFEPAGEVAAGSFGAGIGNAAACGVRDHPGQGLLAVLVITSRYTWPTAKLARCA